MKPKMKTNIRILLLLLALAVLSVGIGRMRFVRASGTWSPTLSMATARTNSQATRLLDGRVLLTGGCNSSGALTSSEIFDPVTETWSPTGSLNRVRCGHRAVLLPDGRVLVTGGAGLSLNAEIYNPVTDEWTLTGAMSMERTDPAATLLPSGQVLVAGGYTTSSAGFRLNTAEIYDPVSGNWSMTGSMGTERAVFAAILLNNGRVLVTGGYTNSAYGTNTSEIYDPATGVWSPGGPISEALGNEALVKLTDGRILRAGGYRDGVILSSAEIYDPSTNTWSLTGSMSTTRCGQTGIAALLLDGKVLIAGAGIDTDQSTEVYDPATGMWSPAGLMNTPRGNQTTTLLMDGKVLVAGGNSLGGVTATAELYDGPQPTPTPSPTPTAGQAVQNLIATVGNMGLPNGAGNSLIASLSNIDLSNLSAACGKLDAFINQVNAKQASGQLTTSQADQFRQQANAVKAKLLCS